MAGGGIRGGEVHGSSDTRAAYPANHPVSPFDLGEVRVRDVAGGGFRGLMNWVYFVAFSPDGKMLASTGYDQMVKLRQLS
jgi:WD40 repeat protein